VWVMDTDPSDPSEARPGVLIDWPVHLDAPRRVAFVADLASPCVSLSDLRAQDQAAAQREELNALYVAMTRARDLLLFSRTPPYRGDAGASWWTRTLPHGRAWSLSDAPSVGPAAVAAGSVTVIELPKPPGASGAKPLPAARPEASRAAKLGRAVHRVLQWTGAGPPGIDPRTLAAAALDEFDLPPEAGEAVVSYVRAIRGSPALQRFLDPALFVWSADEFDVVSAGDSLRIDRLVRLGPEQRESWWVLDYKLAFDAAADEDLRRQLSRYRSAVQELAGDVPVHAAFITGDGALHELQPLDRAAE